MALIFCDSNAGALFLGDMMNIISEKCVYAGESVVSRDD